MILLRKVRRELVRRSRVAKALIGRRPPANTVAVDRCYACGSKKVAWETVSHARLDKTQSVLMCRRCEHIAAPANVKDYSKFTSLTQLGNTPRVGSDEAPGREYHMAKMAAEIMGRGELTVLICGPGRSVDYRWIAKLKNVRKVAVADLMKLVDDVEWVDLNSPVSERFDIVIACEVVEHFTDPPNDFAKTLSYVKDDGLVVCSTNINSGRDANNHDYLFIKGHTSYYSPKALAHIARKNGVYVDFRLPEVATTKAGGPRKRYVLFTPSVDRQQEISVYFGRHLFAPSEKNPQPALKV